MTSVTLSIGELIGVILAISGLNYLIITLALAPLRESLDNLKNSNTVIFDKLGKAVTKEDCEKNMKNCKELRGAQEHGHVKHA